MKRNLNFILKVVTVIAIITFVIAIFVTSQKQDAIRKDLKTIIAAQEMKQPTPKNGKDASIGQVKRAVSEYIAANPVKNGENGMNATDDQIQKAVDNYFTKHPVKNGHDGKTGEDGANGTDGINGVTPELRCNTVANRWEVRYGPDQSWQLLNGSSVKCTQGES